MTLIDGISAATAALAETTMGRTGTVAIHDATDDELAVLETAPHSLRMKWTHQYDGRWETYFTVDATINDIRITLFGGSRPATEDEIAAKSASREEVL